MGIATFGAGVVDERSNMETIRVVDVASRRTFFNAQHKGGLLGQVGGYHADISESGRAIAVASTLGLAVYHLPRSCDDN